MKMRSENQVLLSGDIPQGFIQTHENHNGRKMYTGEMHIFRDNCIYDVIPVIATEEMVKRGTDFTVSVYGEMRSRKDHKLTVDYVTALGIDYLDRPEEKDANEVYLIGDVINIIPLKVVKEEGEEKGNWILARVLLSVKRAKRRNGHQKSDCISCLVWNENAETVRNFEKGQKLKVFGRFQSRERWCSEKQERITELDVSVKKLEVL